MCILFDCGGRNSYRLGGKVMFFLVLLCVLKIV